jgi:hypothetical protein
LDLGADVGLSFVAWAQRFAHLMPPGCLREPTFTTRVPGRLGLGREWKVVPGPSNLRISPPPSLRLSIYDYASEEIRIASTGFRTCGNQFLRPRASLLAFSMRYWAISAIPATQLLSNIWHTPGILAACVTSVPPIHLTCGSGASHNCVTNATSDTLGLVFEGFA